MTRERGQLRRWLFAVAALATSLAPVQVVQAQQTATNLACQQFILQQVAPVLAVANNFNPNGVWPVGFAPLGQPFVANPFEGALYGYPRQAYYLSYVGPYRAWPRPQPVPLAGGYPPPMAYPAPAMAGYAAPPPDLGSLVPSVDGDPQLSSAAILARVQSDGTLDQMSPSERASFLISLAQLQQSEISQRLQQATLQQNAMVNMVNIRRVPFDLASAFQERAHNWRDSYTFYASTLLAMLQAVCPGAITPTGVIGPLSPVCIANPTLPGCQITP